MTASQSIQTITAAELLASARSLRERNYRLVQISATRLPEQVELTYSFDLDFRLANLRVLIPGTDSRVPSIGSVFGCAVLYENEIHDLFNVTIEGLALDFGGNFYKTSVKFPFGSAPSTCAPAAKPQTDPTAGKTADAQRVSPTQ